MHTPSTPVNYDKQQWITISPGAQESLKRHIPDQRLIGNDDSNHNSFDPALLASCIYNLLAHSNITTDSNNLKELSNSDLKDFIKQRSI